MDEGERMPVRLVQENGEVIPLDATSIDIVVERQQSYFGLPFMHAKRMGFDMNQASVTVEVQGVFADEEGQEETAQAIATLDFYQPQQVVTWGQPVNGGGGTPSGPVSSGFNLGGPSGSIGIGAGIAGGIGNSGSFAGGIGGSFGGGMTSVTDLGNRVLKYWNKKYIEFPVAYWVEESGSLLNPVSNGLQLWFKSDSVLADSGSLLPAWLESSGNGRHANQSDVSKQPIYRTEGVNGQPYIQFKGVDEFLEINNSPFFNSEEFTVFTVAKHSATGDIQPVFSSVHNNTGYAVIHSADNSKGQAVWYDGSSGQAVTTGTNLVKNTDAHILTYTMDDTDADSDSDKVILFVNGDEKVSQTSIDYSPNLTGNFNIGKLGNDFFQGDIYEIIVYNRVLTVAERQEVEGYLSVKYGINLPAGHEYAGTGQYSHDSRHVRVVFDKEMVASKQEPYGFLNQWRDTEMQIATEGVSGNTLTVTGGSPDEWFEITESDRDILVVFYRGGFGQPVRSSTNSIFTAKVLSVTSSTMTIAPQASGVTLQDGDEIYILPINYLNSSLVGRRGKPVVVLPIKNADTFSEFAATEKAVGPEFPNHENGDPRDGSSFTRTDEYITYLLSKALSSNYLDLGKEVDALGNTTMDKAFSVSISKSVNDHNSRLTITQQYPSSLGALSDSINTTLGVGQMPVTQGFSGGKSGKRVKSGGDKVQDLLGIVGNSNNYAGNPDLNFATKVLSKGIEYLKDQIIPVEHEGDYIRGIQIPYLSYATKGQNALDSHVAQRNFFLTTEGPTSGKLSTINDIHASRLFSHSAEGHRKNGISGLLTDMTVNREAEIKAYEFGLKFTAADIIL